MTIKLFLSGGQNVLQNGNFCLNFENSRNGPILRLQMRAKNKFNHHQFFSTNKQDVKIKLIQNETNLGVCFW